MSNSLIKLKVNQQNQNSQSAKAIKETFIKACTSLDASLFEPLIDEEQVFENLDKYRFLDSMKTRFDNLKSKGVTEVFFKKGACRFCMVGNKTYEFYSDKDFQTLEFAYAIVEKFTLVTDIFICRMSTGYNHAL
jgi:hypothetical protein